MKYKLTDLLDRVTTNTLVCEYVNVFVKLSTWVYVRVRV